MCGTEKKENTLTKHFSSIVFPFRYDAAQLETEAFNTAFAGRNGQPMQLWLPDDLQSYHLKENVAAMLGIGAEKGTVGQVWKMNDALRRKLDLPQLTDAVRFAYRSGGKGAEAILCLKEIRLVLFTTGIGFLEVMVTCEGTAELVQDVNYFLCEVSFVYSSFVRFQLRSPACQVTTKAKDKEAANVVRVYRSSINHY